MKTAIATNGKAVYLLDHTAGNVSQVDDRTTLVFVEDPLTPIPDTYQGIVLNTSVGIQNYLLNPDQQVAVDEQILGVKPGQAQSTIFALFNGAEFSDWLEVSFETQFMTGNVGPEVGFTIGTGLKVLAPLDEAIPQISKLREFLAAMRYRGEILVYLNGDYTINSVEFGHFYGHFSLFAEASTATSVQYLLDFCGGQESDCTLHESLVAAVLCSAPPFPYNLPQGSTKLSLPRNASHHFWRLQDGLLEYCLVTASGSYLSEVRKRIRRSLNNMAAQAPEVQYRVDYGNNARFVLEADRYAEMLTNPYHKRKDHPTSTQSRSTAQKGTGRTP